MLIYKSEDINAQVCSPSLQLHDPHSASLSLHPADNEPSRNPIPSEQPGTGRTPPARYLVCFPRSSLRRDSAPSDFIVLLS